MAWPDTSLTTYVANSTPSVKSADLNAIQKSLGDLWGSTAGRSRYIVWEDFDAYQFTLDLSAATPSGYIQGSKLIALRIVGNPRLKMDDLTPPVDGTFGLLRFKNSDGAAINAGVQPGHVGLGTRDYYFSCRLRVHLRANLDTYANLGVTAGVAAGAGAGGNAMFIGGSGNNGFGNSNWVIQNPAGTNFDSGVAINNDQFYWFEVVRISGTTSYIIDSVVKHQETDTLAYTSSYPFCGVVGLALAANTEYVGLDKLGYIAFTRP